MKEIPLTQNKVAIVDDEVYEDLSQFRWHVNRDGYSVRKPGKTAILMHRYITQAPKGMEVDHINGDRLDNRRENLRLCTRRENMQNTQKLPRNRSGFKGVSWAKQNKKWWARIHFEGKYINLGHYNDPVEAARAYDAKAKELFGEFARTNF